MTTATFVTAPANRFAVDAGRRVIEGLVAPYGVPTRRVSRRADGSDAALMFAPSSLQTPADLTRLKLLRDHDPARAVGKAVAAEQRPDGLWVRFSVARGAAGDEALALAGDGVLDGLSVGVDYGDDDFTDEATAARVRRVNRADVREVSLCAMPSFDDARVTRVAASQGATRMPEPAAANAPEPTAAATTATVIEHDHAAPPATRFTIAELGQARELFAGPSSSGNGDLERPRIVDPTRPNGHAAPDPAAGLPRGGVPPLMPNRAQLAELTRAFNDRQPCRITCEHEPAETFATITTATSHNKTRDTLPVRALNPLRIADLVGMPVQDVGYAGEAAFPVFGAGTPPGVTAEGGAKPEFSAVTPGSAIPGVLASWTDVTAQLQSIDGFEQKLRNKLARLIALGENERMRAIVAGTAGLPVQAFVAGDQAVQILRAGATIEAAVGVRPDLMLFNPSDTLAIFGTSVSNAWPAEIAELSMKVFGMISLPMSTQPAGFVLVGAWAACSQFVSGQGLVYMVDPYTQMKNNVVTIMGEEAMSLGVEEVTGFTSVDIIV